MVLYVNVFPKSTINHWPGVWEPLVSHLVAAFPSKAFLALLLLLQAVAFHESRPETWARAPDEDTVEPSPILLSNALNEPALLFLLLRIEPDIEIFFSLPESTNALPFWLEALARIFKDAFDTLANVCCPGLLKWAPYNVKLPEFKISPRCGCPQKSQLLNVDLKLLFSSE